MTEKTIDRAVRYLLIAIVYNCLISIIAYTLDWVNDTFFKFTWANWDFIEWWLFISVLIIIGGFMLYMAPFFEKWLYVRLQKRIEKTLNGFKDNVK